MANKSPPSCFASEWNETAVECRGGLDPLYTDPETETSRRPRCDWYGPCGAAQMSGVTREELIQRQKREQMIGQNVPAQAPTNMGNQVLIPPDQLLRQPFTIPTPTPTTTFQQATRQFAQSLTQMQQQVPVSVAPRPSFQLPAAPAQAQPAQQVAPAPVAYMQQPHQQQPMAMVPPQMAVTPHHVPMNYVMPGAQVPSFLTVPEPIVQGQHWAVRLLYSLGRGCLKASGMVLANFFDHTPVNKWPPPPGSPQ